MRGKKWKKYLMALYAVVLLLVISPKVSALYVLDSEAVGSVKVTMQTSDGVTVGGGTLALYYIAGVEFDEIGQSYYVYTEAFSGCDEALLEEIGDASLADTFLAYVENNSVKADAAASVSSDGTAEFPGLGLGVYLIAQTYAADGYYAVSK